MLHQKAEGQRAMESQQGGCGLIRNEKSHKFLRSLSHKIGYPNVLKNLRAQNPSSPGRQYGNFNISVKDA